MAKAKRKRRTSIRTASGNTQAQFLARLRVLRDDPTVVLPECVGEEPKPLRVLRRRIERLASGAKPGFLDKRDRDVLGAVVHSIPIADRDAVPRLIDMKVGKQRRFFIQRGHISRPCCLGVQNHDDPSALAMAYQGMAKKHGFHFFAKPGLWCTGSVAAPPEAWLAALSRRAEVELLPVEGGWSCSHGDRPRVRMRFPGAGGAVGGGPGILVCGACGERAGNMHGLVASRYVGPDTRRPVAVDVLFPDGHAIALEREEVAAYRADVKTEADLIQLATATWRQQASQGAGDAPRFILGDLDYGNDQDAFLDAVQPQPWERVALAAMTREGHAGPQEGVAALLDRLRDRLHDGALALLGDADYIQGASATHGDPRSLLRAVHEEAERRRRLAAVPQLRGTGTIGTWVGEVARVHRAGGVKAGRERLERDTRNPPVPRSHIRAFLAALGGSLAVDTLFNADERAAGDAWVALVKPILEAEGDAYVEAVRTYLTETGTGESVQ